MGPAPHTLGATHMEAPRRDERGGAHHPTHSPAPSVPPSLPSLLSELRGIKAAMRQAIPVLAFLLLLEAAAFAVWAFPASSCAAFSKGRAAAHVAPATAQLRASLPGSDSGDADSTLREVVERLAGPNRTVILASATSNYLDFLLNWYTTVDRLGYGARVLFVAEDQVAYDFLQRKWPGQVVRESVMLGGDRGRGSHQELPPGNNGTFGSDFFLMVVDRRPAYFLALMELNVSFLYSDVDIVLQKDPFPFFTGDFDLWVQEDSQTYEGATSRFPQDQPASPIKLRRHHLCTCFMFVRPTQGSRILMERWDRSVKQEVARGKKAVANQVEWNKVVYNTLSSDVALGVLPVAKFPSGCIYFPWPEVKPKCNKSHRKNFQTTWPHWYSNIVMVHNNWVFGKEAKMQRFKEAKLWFVTPEAAEQAGLTSVPQQSQVHPELQRV